MSVGPGPVPGSSRPLYLYLPPYQLRSSNIPQHLLVQNRERDKVEVGPGPVSGSSRPLCLYLPPYHYKLRNSNVTNMHRCFGRGEKERLRQRTRQTGGYRERKIETEKKREIYFPYIGSRIHSLVRS